MESSSFCRTLVILLVVLLLVVMIIVMKSQTFGWFTTLGIELKIRAIVQIHDVKSCL